MTSNSLLEHRDPQGTSAAFSEILYTSDALWSAMYNSLSDDGVLVVQLGEAPRFYDPPESLTKHSNRAYVTTLLGKVGFESIHIYDEGGCGFSCK